MKGNGTVHLEENNAKGYSNARLRVHNADDVNWLSVSTEDRMSVKWTEMQYEVLRLS